MPAQHECDDMNQRINDMDASIHTQLRELDTKIDVHHSTLTTHIESFKVHEKEQIARHIESLSSQALNTKAINDLTISVSGVVKAYNTANGVGRFVKWSAGIVVAVTAAWTYMKNG